MDRFKAGRRLVLFTVLFAGGTAAQQGRTMSGVENMAEARRLVNTWPANVQELPGSVVYIARGNVWLYVPSTRTKRQITTDGDYHSPSLADDGTIGAVRRIGGTSHFVTISTAGETHSFAPDSRTNVVHAELSPNGRLFAYVYVVVSPLSDSPASVGVTWADRWGAAALTGAGASYHHARWMTDERLILSGGGAYPYLVRGQRSGWDSESSAYMVSIPAFRNEVYAVARDGTRLLAVGATYAIVNYEEQITGWHVIAYRPARPDEQVPFEYSLEELRACRYDSTARYGGGRCVPGWIPEARFSLESEPRGAAISPDGRALVFADRRGLLITDPISPTARAHVIDPGGSDPAWGIYSPERSGGDHE